MKIDSNYLITKPATLTDHTIHFLVICFLTISIINNLLNKTDINVVRRKTDKKIKNCILCKKANLFFLGLKIVTYPPLCMYIVRYSRIHFDLLSQSSDMHVNRSCIPRIIISPYCIQQILSAVYFVWMKYQ